MQLDVYRENLLPEYKNISYAATSFEMFKPEVREVIRAVGRAVFRNEDRYNGFNAIIVPDKNSLNIKTK